MATTKPPEVEEIPSEVFELVSPEMDAWLNSWPSEELARYGGKYIAVRQKQVVAADESLGRLFKTLDSLGLTHRVRIRYVERPDALVIY